MYVHMYFYVHCVYCRHTCIHYVIMSVLCVFTYECLRAYLHAYIQT